MKRRSRRRSRRNSWSKHPRLHRRAARKGWRGSRKRRTRRNAGSLVHRTQRAALSGFSIPVLRRGTTILAGNVGTTFFTEQLAKHFPAALRGSLGQVATLAVVALAQSTLVSSISFLRKALNPADILIGGMLAAVTRTARLVAPGTFSTCGLGEDLDGLGDWMASPGNISRAFPLMNGMGAYASPSAPEIMAGLGWAPGPGTPQIMAGMSDSAIVPQVGRAFPSLGMADYEIQHEIASQV